MKALLRKKVDHSVIKAIEDVDDIQKGLCDTLRISTKNKVYLIPISDTEYIELVYPDDTDAS